jgi:hypothetical protein
VPLFPFWLVNIAPAFANVRLRTFAAATALGIVPGTFAFAFVGQGLDSVLDVQAQWQACIKGSATASCPEAPSLADLITPELLLAYCRTRSGSVDSRRVEKVEREDMKFDIAVIGAGSAGLSVAAAAAQFGQSVILFEKGEMGGDCLNSGCVPSKALLAAAKAAEAHRTSDGFGIAGHEPGVDFAAVMAHVQRVIAAIAPHDSQARFETLGVKVVRAAAKFIGPQTLEAGGDTYEARRIVIATGSRAAVPPVEGLEAVPFFTNETIFRNTTLPSHLIIIGGGPIGLEMAQAHRRLGAQVTVLEAFDPLGRDDPELATVVLDACAARASSSVAGRTSRRWKKLQAACGCISRAMNASWGRICWSPPVASPTLNHSTSRQQASPIRPRASPWTACCAAPTGMSTRPAMWRAARSSPMPQAIMPGTSSVTCSSASAGRRVTA